MAGILASQGYLNRFRARIVPLRITSFYLFDGFYQTFERGDAL